MSHVEDDKSTPRGVNTSLSVTIIVPALNEAANLREVLPRLPKVDEVILVDGGSVDSTVATALELMPDIRVLQQTRKGKGNALAVGFNATTSDVIVMFDADGSADPREIPAFIKAIEDGADFAKGSRFMKGGGSEDITFIRRLGNGFLHLVFNIFFGSKFTDLCYGYNAFRTTMVPKLHLPDTDIPGAEGQMLWGDGFEIETLLSCRMVAADAKITEVPSVELERIHGESNLRTFSDGIRVLRTLFSERAHAAAREAEAK